MRVVKREIEKSWYGKLPIGVMQGSMQLTAAMSAATVSCLVSA